WSASGSVWPPRATPATRTPGGTRPRGATRRPSAGRSKGEERGGSTEAALGERDQDQGEGGGEHDEGDERDPLVTPGARERLAARRFERSEVGRTRTRRCGGCGHLGEGSGGRVGHRGPRKLPPAPSRRSVGSGTPLAPRATDLTPFGARRYPRSPLSLPS